MCLYFIADIHLTEQQPLITKKFKDLLCSIPNTVTAIYILGDLFEAWIGDDENTEFQQEIARLLKHTSLRLPIYFMPGNRDFLLSENYCNKSGMTLLTEPTIIEIDKTPTLLLHGDGLCTQDKVHQYYRKLVRTNTFIKFFLLLPLKIRKLIANFMRNNSQKRNTRIATELMDVDTISVKKIMRKFKVNQLIYGHTHRPSIYYYDLDRRINKIFVLSDWHVHGHVLRVDAERFESIYF